MSAREHSLRGRLLALLAALVLAGSALQMATAFRAAVAEADDLFDYHMRQIALSLRDAGHAVVGSGAFGAPADFDFVIQVWSAQGVRVYQSHDHDWLPHEAVLGFSRVQAPGGDWRTFAVATGDRVIQVAQSLRVRRRLALRYAARSVWPMLAFAALLLGGVWWVVSSSLAPIARTRREIAERGADSLEPVDARGLPSEIAPLVAELNALIARMKEALQARQRFVGDAAHELRTPVTALKLQLQMLERARDEATRAQAMERLRGGVERATRLVEQLMALEREQAGEGAANAANAVDAASTASAASHASAANAAHAANAAEAAARATAGDATPRPAQAPATSLAQVAREAIASCADAAAARTIEIELQVADDVQLELPAARIETVLRNLVDNAVRYAPQGGRVRVSVGREGLQAVAIVDDSGPGIPVEDRERVFDRFYRRPGAPASGSGLGLAIVRTALDALSGTVELSDSPLGGLRATVRLPAPAPVGPIGAP